LDRNGRTNTSGFVTDLKKQLAQVFTGEGKSLILALLSIILALLGCDVKCACYRYLLQLVDTITVIL